MIKLQTYPVCSSVRGMDNNFPASKWIQCFIRMYNFASQLQRAANHIASIRRCNVED